MIHFSVFIAGFGIVRVKIVQRLNEMVDCLDYFS